jgi:hypothetical protein
LNSIRGTTNKTIRGEEATRKKADVELDVAWVEEGKYDNKEEC